MATGLQKGVLSLIIVSTQWACMQSVPEYRFTADFSPEKLEQDKEECRSAQRAAGNNENKIEKCLEAKGWVVIEKEVPTENSAGIEDNSTSN